MDPDLLTAVLWLGFSFVLGTVVGSFLNVCIYRLPGRQSLVAPPSHCPECQHRLSLWRDMAPLVSQLLCRSRCRYCGARFSWRYFWVELITGACFAAVAWRYQGDLWQVIPGWVFVSALIAIAFMDLAQFIVPDEPVWVALAAGVVKDLALIARGQSDRLWHTFPGIEGQVPVPASILGALVSFWLLWQLAALASAAVKVEAMGGGDSFLLAAIGANLWPLYQVAMAFMIAVGLGAVVGVIQLALWERRRPTAASALAPVGVGPDGAALAMAAPGPGPGSDESDGSDGSDRSDSAPAPHSDEPPQLPWESRVGRVLTVAGTWFGVVGAWWIAARWTHGEPGAAVSGGLLILTAAAALLYYGGRLWRRGDADWEPAAQEHHEAGPPGPRVIAFCPYLVIGALAAMLGGDRLLQAYLAWLGLAAGGY